ncbi:hypothetical protein V5O48_009858 [Marasmius crinis-equi]|uniref:F-box domain-containing protein n=1 Tax=Marasmius crinis-equi TaxID=585013 RepID=A0ABR3FA06_9AGAR
MTLPFEIIIIIIESLDDPDSRAALAALSATAEPLLRLLEHPLQTISSARVESLNITHTRYPPATFNRLLTWQKLDSGWTFSSMVPCLKQLSLNWVGWWTLTGESKRRLLDEFRTVTHLQLFMTAFDTYDDFLPFLSSFPALEVLDLDTVRPALHWEPTTTLDGNSLPLNLRKICLGQIDDWRMIDSLVPCRGLESLTCRFRDFDATPAQCMVAINRLLESAGHSLLNFEFAIEEYRSRLDSSRDDMTLDLSKNPALRSLSLSPYHILPTLATLTRCRDPTQLTSVCLPRHAGLDWERLDMILSCHPSFGSLVEVLVEERVSDSGVVLNPRALMPLCDEKGLLRA